MATKKPKPNKRIIFELSPKGEGDLDKLQKILGGTNASLIRQALGFFKTITEYTEQGYSVKLEKINSETGEKETVTLLLPSTFF